MSHTARAIRILSLIPSAPEYVTAREIEQKLLAAGYAVSFRAVERDLLKLERDFPLRRTTVDQRAIRWSSMAGESWVTVPMPIGRAA